MKRITLILSALIFGATAAMAQDIITKRNGEDVEAKIVEVNQNDLRYKKANNPDGPTYTIAKKDVLLVRYQNGTNEIFDDVAGSYGRTPAEGVTPGMKYKQLKRIYSYKDYIPGMVERYRKPGGCGVASFFIPGLGQFIEGEVGRGLGWLGGSIVAGALYGVGIAELPHVDSSFDGAHLALLGGSLVGLACSICATIDAVRIAKVQNLYYEDLKTLNYTLELHPSVDYIRTPSGNLCPAAGLTFAMKF